MDTLHEQRPGWRKRCQIYRISGYWKQDQGKRGQERYASIKSAQEDHETNCDGGEQKDDTEQDIVTGIEVKRETCCPQILQAGARGEWPTEIRGRGCVENMMERSKVRRDADNGEPQHQHQHHAPSNACKGGPMTMEASIHCISLVRCHSVLCWNVILSHIFMPPLRTFPAFTSLLPGSFPGRTAYSASSRPRRRQAR